MPTADPTIACPNCKTSIRLTESLAAPLVDATRREYEHRLAQKADEYRQREVSLTKKEDDLIRDRRLLRAELENTLNTERQKIAAEEARKAKTALTLELSGKAREIEDLKSVLEEREGKLAEAQKQQLQFLQKERALATQHRELELTIEKRVAENLHAACSQIKREAEDQAKLKVFEKEQVISSMQAQIEELRRRSEQGSQQLQGEAQELQLESLLSAKFPFDAIESIKKGEHGGDILQRVGNLQGARCGTILWETKRTKTWSDGWLAKLRDDQRAAKADIAVIVSQTLPKGIESFDLVDNVWVLHPRMVAPVAVSLRCMLIEVATARQASEGRQEKAEMVYEYLTGPRFRQRIQALVEAFNCMQEDLDRERKLLLKQWAKRQEQIDRMMQATVGMFGELEGITGKTLGEVEGLSLDAYAQHSLPLIA